MLKLQIMNSELCLHNFVRFFRLFDVLVAYDYAFHFREKAVKYESSFLEYKLWILKLCLHNFYTIL